VTWGKTHAFCIEGTIFNSYSVRLVFIYLEVEEMTCHIFALFSSPLLLSKTRRRHRNKNINFQDKI
jgi:hypothetical protein